MRPNVESLPVSSWRLCVVTDPDLRPKRSHEEVVREAISGGVDVVQFRDKGARDRDFYDTALRLRLICTEAGIPLIINDRPHIALAVDADGLHVGQADLPADVARRLIGPDRVLGVSVETVPQALEAVREGAQYLGAGPVHDARATKPDASDAIGLEGLRSICEASSVPVLAIGGVTAENASRLLAAGATGAAVVSAIVCAADVRGATEALKEQVCSNLDLSTHVPTPYSRPERERRTE